MIGGEEGGVGAGDTRPVRAITVDTVGEPGARTFYLLAQRDDGESVSLLLEKTQAMLLAEQIGVLFDDLARRNPTLAPVEPAQIPKLQHPARVLFRAGNLALQYNAEVDLISLEIAELRGLNQGIPAVLRLWATRPQIRALGNQAQHVARSGLPIA